MTRVSGPSADRVVFVTAYRRLRVVRKGRSRIASIWCRMSCRDVLSVAGHFHCSVAFLDCGARQFELFCGSLDSVAHTV